MNDTANSASGGRYEGKSTRRAFLGITAGVAAMTRAAQAAATVPIIDTHIHLFDPTRPQGVPWPNRDDAILFHRALPERYRKIAVPSGIRGAIEVEASPWLEDNQWVLDVAAKDPIIVGTVGDLEPGHPQFHEQLERFHRNQLFRGIRYGNLWGRNLGAGLAKPEFVAGLKALADAGLELDTANPDAALIADVVQLSDRVPSLRIVIDHLPHLEPPTDSAARRAYEANLQELGKRPQIYVKVSEVLRSADGRTPLDLNFYRPRLDQLWDIFGPDRLMYGSDWPNSDHWGTYQQVLEVVRSYLRSKGREAEEKFFWRNSVKAYRWSKRDATQPS